MYDTLWLGCSHSSGSYCKDTGELIDQSHSIPSVLATKLNQRWKSISFPGDGVMKYAEAVKLLDENKLLSNFRNIIIQRTYEPRMTFFNDSDYIYDRILEYVNDPNRFETIISVRPPTERTFSLFAHQNYDQYHSKFAGKEIVLIDMFENISHSVDPRESTTETTQYPSLWVDVHYDYIKYTADKNNCKLYMFDYVGSFRNQNRRWKINKPFKRTLINGDQDFVFHHLTEQNRLDLLASAQHPTHGAVDLLVDILYKELNDEEYK